jgi:hypothetical protein
MRQVWNTLGVKALLHYSSRLTIQLSFLVFSLRLKVTRETRRIGTSHRNSPLLSHIDELGCAAVIKYVKLLPLLHPPMRACMDALKNQSAQRATQLRSVLACVYAVSIQNQITTTVP